MNNVIDTAKEEGREEAMQPGAIQVIRMTEEKLGQAMQRTDEERHHKEEAQVELDRLRKLMGNKQGE